VADPYTHRNLLDVEDAAAKFGHGELQESRFANQDLQTEQTGLSLHRVRPGRRQPFGHVHAEVEEVYVVLSGSGQARVGEDLVEVRRLDALRVSPGVTRAFEAGDDGLELLAFSPLRTDDRGEILEGWWGD
jgi:mannose-6-phosphate isomerase-like protein (cupin superfamily)